MSAKQNLKTVENRGSRPKRQKKSEADEMCPYEFGAERMSFRYQR